MSDTPLKHCKKCDEDYPATTEFWYSSKRSKDGLGRPCKACRSAQQKAYRNQPGTKEKIYAQQKEYLNRAEVQEHRRAYLKDYGEIYNSRSDVKERKRVLAKKYYRQPDIREKKLTHLRKPEVRKRINSYRSRPEVREKNLAYCKEYHSRPNVKERHRSYEHTRNARKKSILGVHSPAQIKDQLRRQKYRKRSLEMMSNIDR